MSESRNEVSAFAGAAKAALAANELSMLQSEVERLTALVNQDTIDYDELDTELCDSRHTVTSLATEVIRLLAITGEMRAGLMESNADRWRRDVLDEWDRRARGVT